MTLPILQKPRMYEPCNSCGRCCVNELCELAMMVFRPGHGPYSEEWDGPCPALEWEGEKSRCGLVAKYPQLAERLMIGNGCLAPDTETA